MKGNKRDPTEIAERLTGKVQDYAHAFAVPFDIADFTEEWFPIELKEHKSVHINELSVMYEIAGYSLNDEA